MFKTPYQRETLSNPLTICEEESLCEQHHAIDCDIANIMRKHSAGDMLAHVKNVKLQFGDFTEINEYDDALNTIAKSREAFEALPSKVREAFGNNPGLFVEAVTDPSRRDDLVRLGLATVAEEKQLSNNPKLEAAIIDMVAKASESVPEASDKPKTE